MKSIKLPALAAIASLLACPSSFASVKDYLKHYYVQRTDVPLPASVVNPTDLPWRFRGATITLSFVVEKSGALRDIRVESPADPELSKLLVPVVATWRFTPALKDGAPVAKRVVMPITIVDENG